jgi:hypothetical protein
MAACVNRKATALLKKGQFYSWGFCVKLTHATDIPISSKKIGRTGSLSMACSWDSKMIRLIFFARCILGHLEFTSITIMEAQNAAIAAKPIPARAKISSVVLNCLRFQFD